MSTREKRNRFLSFRSTLIKTEEQAAVLTCRMVYGNGFQALHDEVEEIIGDNFEEEDELDMLDSGIEYLESLLLKTTIAEAKAKGYDIPKTKYMVYQWLCQCEYSGEWFLTETLYKTKEEVQEARGPDIHVVRHIDETKCEIEE